MVHLRQSDLLLDDSDGNAEWQTMREALGMRGFKTRPILVDSVYVAVPMQRRRSYLVCRVFAVFILFPNIISFYNRALYLHESQSAYNALTLRDRSGRKRLIPK